MTDTDTDTDTVEVPSSAEAWADLVAAGLLGTERRPLPDSVAQTVATLLGPAPGAGDGPASPGEVELLTAAGVLGAYRRAGGAAAPATASPTSAGADAPAPAPADPRPLAPEPALRLLDLLLAGHVSVLGTPAELLGLWLDRAAASGYRLPPARLVDLLGTATTRIELRAPVGAIGGPLGSWLGERNPAWSWVRTAGGAVGGTGRADGAVGPLGDQEGGSTGSSTVEERWATGSRDDRLALLAQVRSSDPGAGLALVESTWKGEKAADRAAIVDVLAATVTMADEPFLEAALDDRGKAVREKAAALLKTMPESRLAHRAAERLVPLVYAPRGLLRRKVDVSLPTDLDPAALARDGFVERLRPSQMGVHAWELVHLVAVAPLRTWTDLLSLDPAQVVNATSGSDNFPALVRGWTTAVSDQRWSADRTAWVQALLGLPDPSPSLLTLLPGDLVHAEATRRLTTCPESQIATLVSSLPGPWPGDLTRLVIERLSTTKGGSSGHGALVAMASRATPESIPDLQAWAARLGADEDARVRHLVNQAVSTISFRQSILQELP